MRICSVRSRKIFVRETWQDKKVEKSSKKLLQRCEECVD